MNSRLNFHDPFENRLDALWWHKWPSHSWKCQVCFLPEKYIGLSLSFKCETSNCLLDHPTSLHNHILFSIEIKLMMFSTLTYSCYFTMSGDSYENIFAKILGNRQEWICIDTCDNIRIWFNTLISFFPINHHVFTSDLLLGEENCLQLPVYHYSITLKNSK